MKLFHQRINILILNAVMPMAHERYASALLRAWGVQSTYCTSARYYSSLTP
jgi:hypothetical protein